MQERALGWDINTPHSAPRGNLFGPDGFGHTGFTGTSLWVDKATSSFVVILTSRLHPDGKAPSPTALRRGIATLVASTVERVARETGGDARVLDISALFGLGEIRSRAGAPPAVEAALKAVEQADLLVVGSPVYKGSYTGLFKHFVDFIDYRALIGTPVALLATGGSDRHALVIEHQLRPLFSFFQAHTLPIGVYATDKEFDNYRVSGDALRARIALAVERAVPVLRRRGELPRVVPTLALA